MDKMIAELGDLELMWDSRDYEDGASASDVTISVPAAYADDGDVVRYIVDGNELTEALHRLGFTGEA